MVWERLMHHEIKSVFGRRRRPGGCVVRGLRGRRHGALRGRNCAGPWYDGTVDDIWPDDPDYGDPDYGEPDDGEPGHATDVPGPT